MTKLRIPRKTKKMYRKDGTLTFREGKRLRRFFRWMHKLWGHAEGRREVMDVLRRLEGI